MTLWNFLFFGYRFNFNIMNNWIKFHESVIIDMDFSYMYLDT